MFTSLVPRIAGDDEPPDDSRHRLGRRRLGAVLAVASALAMAIAMMAAPQPAQALTAIDGQWTVVHGGTGQLSLNSDGTYTSTCEVYPNYEDAWCPAPSGTFQYSTMSTASVTFNGADGSTTSYRVSGLVSSPDTITSVFGSRTYSPLVMKKGAGFTCTQWSGTGTSFTQWGISPLVEYDATSNLLYATGSHDLIGPKSIDTQVNLAETAPNYFQTGPCGGPYTELTTASFIYVGGLVDASVSYSAGTWIPQAIVTIKDLAEAPASDATVSGTFSDDAGTTLQRSTCVTATDGTCTLAGPTADAAVTSIQLWVSGVTKTGSSFTQAVSSVRDITLNKPSTSTPPPATTTHHVSDLDNATSSTSSSKKWQPQVTVTVVDANGVVVAGATVSGTFSSQNGTVTCITAADGTCTLVSSNLTNRVNSTVFTVTNVVKDSSAYTPTANSDLDGDSDGTTITVNRP